MRHQQVADPQVMRLTININQQVFNRISSVSAARRGPADRCAGGIIIIVQQNGPKLVEVRVPEDLWISGEVLFKEKRECFHRRSTTTTFQHCETRKPVETKMAGDGAGSKRTSH